jgi:uncharacterized protein YcaQ
VLELSLTEARRLAVGAQLLSGPQPTDLVVTATHLGGLQIDPTNAVARTERLVLWSRLGAYEVADLATATFEDRKLFEYWAYIVPAADYPVHRETMRRYPRTTTARGAYICDWLEANSSFRRYVLGALRRRGPLRSRDLEDRAVEPWRTTGWNDGKNVGRMLDILWFGGRIAIAGRDGNERLWDLAERRYPVGAPRLSQSAVAEAVLERNLGWRGVALPGEFNYTFDGRPPGWERALRALVRRGVARTVTIEGLTGEWYVHVASLDRPWIPRTTLLSPFDQLIHNRERTRRLFGFDYRLEIYVPRAERRYGYFVLPILHGDRLVGRIDPLVDRSTGTLVVHAVHAEPEAPAAAGDAIAASIRDLAGWAGTGRVELPSALPRSWARALRESVAV